MDGYLEGKIGGNEIFLKKDTDAWKKIFTSRCLMYTVIFALKKKKQKKKKIQI